MSVDVDLDLNFRHYAMPGDEDKYDQCRLSSLMCGCMTALCFCAADESINSYLLITKFVAVRVLH